MKCEIGGIQALDDGIFPVDFRRGTLDLVLKFFLFDSLRLGPSYAVGQGALSIGAAHGSRLALEGPGTRKGIRLLVRGSSSSARLLRSRACIARRRHGVVLQRLGSLDLF